MDCVEIRHVFLTGTTPEGPAVSEHVALCPQCQELFEKGAELGRRLAQAVLPAAEPLDLFGAVERDLQGEVGLRASVRAWASWLRASVLVGIGALLLMFHLLFDRRADFAEYGPAVFWGVTLAFGAALVLGSFKLMRGASVSAPAQARLAFVLLLLPTLGALLAPLGGDDAGSSWGSPSACFNYGALLVVPFLLLAWLFERRDAIPLPALLTAGALAGVVANLLLHAHCPAAHLGHLLLGHASIGLVWALGLGLLSRVLQRRG